MIKYGGKMKEIQNETTKEKLVRLLLTILNWGYDVEVYDDDLYAKVKKRLKLHNEYDTIRMRCCIDLIEDTENAILHICEYGLEKFNYKSNNLGEKYLKLYGILNAVYLQMSCIIELYEILNVPNKYDVTTHFKALQIFELRNVAGSHTVNFQDNSESVPQNVKKNFFRITQMQINAKGDKLHAVDGFHNLKEFNLYELIMEYNVLSEEYLYNAMTKYYKSVLPHGNKSLDGWISENKLLDFKHFDYRKLYKNDIAQKQYLSRIRRKLKNEIMK